MEATLTNKLKAVLLGAAAALILFAPVSAGTGGNNNPGNKVTICHATGSTTNPFVQISPNANGVVSGHAGASHQNGEDIIPPFEYKQGNTTQSFAGQNWTAAGQATYNNGCVPPPGGLGGGGQVLGSTTGGRGTGSQVNGTPLGGVGAGAGGASTSLSSTALAGFGGSVLTAIAGMAWLAQRKFQN